MTQIPHLEFSGLLTIKMQLCENALKTSELILDNAENKITMSFIAQEYQCTSNVEHPKFQIFHYKFKSL